MKPVYFPLDPFEASQVTREPDATGEQKITTEVEKIADIRDRYSQRQGSRYVGRAVEKHAGA